jgi:LacI family transcriptional regulator
MTERKNKVTMADIARESGVSLSTVSLVLNGKPGIPSETRAKIFDAARELGYDIHLPSLVQTKPSIIRTIGMLVKRAQGDTAPPSSNIFFSHVIAGIEAGCRQEKINLLYSTLPVDENNNSLEIPALIADSQVDGLLLVGNYVDERLHKALQQRKIPIVLVEAYCLAGEYDAVLLDNFEGAYSAVKYLIEKGHRHIAFLGSFPDSKISFRYRRQGYLQSLQDHGISHAYYGDCPHNNRDQIIATTVQLINENPQITAIFGCNDEVSVIAIHGVLSVGKQVPQDISIIGFDNNGNSENAIPPLTTVNVDKVSMGRLAVQLMLNRAENPEQGFVTMRLHTHLVERQSVRCYAD